MAGAMMLINEKIAQLKRALRFGVAPALATPLLQTGEVNSAEIPNLVDFLLQRGVVGLFVGGTTGEGVLLDLVQRKRLHAAAVAAAAGRVPVILHIGTMRTDQTIELMHHAAEIGADAVAVMTPFFYKLEDEALFAHFAAVASAEAEMPLFAYDIPQMAVNGVSPALAGRLFAELPNMAGMKVSRPDAQGVRALIHITPADRVLLVGNEGVMLGTMAMGADGMISGMATAVPEPFVALGKALAANDLATAQQIQRQINQLLVITGSKARLGSIRALLTARGVDVGSAVLPLPMPDTDPWPAARAVLNL